MREFLCKKGMEDEDFCCECSAYVQTWGDIEPKACIISGRPQEWQEVFEYTRVPVANGSAVLYQTEENIEAEK